METENEIENEETEGNTKMSKMQNRIELIDRLRVLGFTYEEAQELRRIEMTLQRWAERECGDGSNWGLERDETTGKPFNVYHGPGESRRYAVADREAGALRRLAAIMAAQDKRRKLGNGAPKLPKLIAYHQGDCRGCMLYIVRKADVRGQDINSVYNRGLAVAA